MSTLFSLLTLVVIIMASAFYLSFIKKTKESNGHH